MDRIAHSLHMRGLFVLLLAGVVLFFFDPAAPAPAYAPARAAGSFFSIPTSASEPPHRPSAVAATRSESARARDVASTRVYIDSEYRLVRSSRQRLSVSKAAVRSLASRTVAECPLAGSGAYVNAAANQVSDEVVGALAATGYHPDVGAMRTFIAAVRPLRWSSPKITRLAHRYVVKLENLAVLDPPDLCADVKAYAATEFLTAPEATVRFNKLYEAADVEAEEVPDRLLAPYAGARGAALLRGIKKLEAPLGEAEAHAVEQYSQIMRGLALSS